MNVVFDFGAVLFTWRPVDLVAQYFPQQACTPSQAGHLAHAVFAHTDWQNFDRGTLAMALVVQRTAQRLNLDHAALAELVGRIGDLLTPMPDSMALLARLHQMQGTRLYFLSNMPLPYARTLEKNNPFLKWFEGGIFSGDVKIIKPEPAIYQLLQSRYQLEPTQTVFIDDLLDNVKAARALGWHGIHFQSAQQLEAELQVHYSQLLQKD
jgi:putative hydrolase of the HAD superfamily